MLPLEIFRPQSSSRKKSTHFHSITTNCHMSITRECNDVLSQPEESFMYLSKIMMWKIVMTNKITELKEQRRRYTIPPYTTSRKYSSCRKPDGSIQCSLCSNFAYCMRSRNKSSLFNCIFQLTLASCKMFICPHMGILHLMQHA